MHSEEMDVQVRCVVCSREVDVDAEVVYAYGVGDVMCFECAVERGGAYDADEDRWVREPSTEGLPDQRRSEAY